LGKVEGQKHERKLIGILRGTGLGKEEKQGVGGEKASSLSEDSGEKQGGIKGYIPPLGKNLDVEGC